MLICIVFAGIIGLFSIFAFFGDAFSNTGGVVIPNMFQLMFGGRENVANYYVQWKQYGGLTFLFVLQIVIMIMAIVSFFVCYNIRNGGDEASGIIISVITAILSLVASIISFCTLSITDIGGEVRLGAGPIIYSILNLAMIVIYTIGIVRNRYESSYSYTISEKYKNGHSYSSSSSTSSNSKPKLSENERVELIMKYKKMLDEGILTQEEFDKKKKELLDD